MEVPVGSSVVDVEVVSDDISLLELMRSKVNRGTGRDDKEDPFYVVDLGCLLDLYHDWTEALPTVKPFYAVKCNEDPAILVTLAALGTGFDCASKNEIKAVLDLGISPKRIIYAHPCKQTSHLKYAMRKGVSLMTFDNQLELYKVKEHFPSAKLVLRIRADDPNALCQLGMKFGCSVSDGCSLLHTAQELGLEVVGVSFHVGSGSQSPLAYQCGLELAAQVFDYSSKLGFRFSLLDIGGGFPGVKGSHDVFGRVTDAIKGSLVKLFSGYPDLNVIAEPGRFFACSTHSLALNVISKRVSSIPDSSESQSFMYYVNDGVYGSFNCILYDHVTPTPAVLKASPLSDGLHPASVWGPTCDGLDKICDTVLPELSIGDWMYFSDMGAYTVSAASSFNGFLRPMVYYYIRESRRDQFSQLVGASAVQLNTAIDSDITGEQFLVEKDSLLSVSSCLQVDVVAC